MQKPRDRFGSRSLAALGMVLVIVQAYHPSVLLILKEGQTAAWLLAMLSGILTAAVLFLTALVLQKLPGKNLVDLAAIGLGRWFEPVAGMLVVGMAVYLSGITLRQTAEMTISAVFPHTPQTFVMVALLLGAVFIAWGEAASVVRLGQILLPFLLLSIGLVIGGAIGWGETHYLEPWFGPGSLQLLARVPRGSALFGPAFAILLMTDQLADPRGLALWSFGLAVASGLVFGLSILTLLMAFPYPGGLDITMPLHGAARLVLGGRFFERLEGVWLMAWVTTTTLLLGAMIFVGAKGFSRGFRIPRHRPFVPLISSLVLTFALFPHDQAATILLLERSSLGLFLLVQILSLAYAAAAAIRLRRRQA